MKFSLACLLALAGLQAALADPATCEKEAQFVKQELIGQPYTDAVANALQSNPIRVLHPGDMITMEYIASRLNIQVNENNEIISAHCA
ncbi:hypothetical protein KXW98_008536 [Aspergillus fumigatus]|uniref:Elastase inhibitor AFUEI n=4 Tax=Aspergillus TaxID=5052 RepID=IELA_ASPFU|nr:hypothetical protein AFUA_3G14940 [Aspergillus fumigatus Af293]B0XZT4.1 RecName: Full=Elastase inhibitor AFLEI; Flags: Precursor [Aspergillus fumigatus A1163]Q4WZ11.2 RecName: Full=Elastase inhibitor AFUEI; Flags: Precursor [Aspergillus fumigatus Af293]KAF4269514.1 hypothetical protein CNMCM8714_008148 [Aspergillus fumigatus]KMK54281.1 Elastase inhibitor AFUEI [Aspergillus fumigatus Z5]EAL92092.2 hypothetical protein AFUA_3G14940 [Aspergillus fumigatus Af293]EDP52266.1 hypothetical protein